MEVEGALVDYITVVGRKEEEVRGEGLGSPPGVEEVAQFEEVERKGDSFGSEGVRVGFGEMVEGGVSEFGRRLRRRRQIGRRAEYVPC